ncbi:hypothetical protein Clacol_006195 [Clathrus columnatus]|uniref:Uncharacterized protein n=1 Tax=Clathrus columnatus TaxID=1419009 RepID=A0AAV5ABE4_9AGAM|nr:hypothetical protein Clacol_006195 [Clathrus columnatus]
MYNLLVENFTVDTLRFTAVSLEDVSAIIPPSGQHNFVVKRRSFHISVHNTTQEKITESQNSKSHIRIKLKRRLRNGWKLMRNAILPYTVYALQISTESLKLVIFSKRNVSSFLADMPSTLPLSSLLLPGTHNCVAFYGWPVSQCQDSDTPLATQFALGIRVIDVRLSIINGSLLSYHGLYPQKLPFRDIIQSVHKFLTSPEGSTETIVVSIKQEDVGWVQFSKLVYDEIHNGPGGKDFWFLENRIPTLGEVRGKAVLFSRFGGDGRGWEGGLNGIGIHPPSWPDSKEDGFDWWSGNTLVKVQDWYSIPSFLSIPEKAEKAAKALLSKSSTPVLSISFFSAASFPFALPQTVACGIGWPALNFGVEGVNSRVGKWILSLFGTSEIANYKESSNSLKSDIPRLRGWAGNQEKKDGIYVNMTYPNAVAVFCGSSPGTKPEFEHAAKSIGRAIATAGLGFVYGGGNKGLMGSASREAIQAGAEVLGVVPYGMVKDSKDVRASVAPNAGGAKNLVELDLEDVPENFKTLVVQTMHERKVEMSKQVKGFIGLPGGFGTFEELLEVTTWTQLGIHEKPVVIVNVLEFFNPLRDLINAAVDNGFIYPTNAGLIVFVDGPTELSEHITFDWGTHAIQALQNWKKPNNYFTAFNWDKKLPEGSPNIGQIIRTILDIHFIPRIKVVQIVFTPILNYWTMIPNATRTTLRAVRHNLFHSSCRQYAITKFGMPAMSPTMTEGGIARWKKREGESFIGGDVLLEIETDKATIDVEAQDDGVVGKIIMPDGSKNVPVGKIIALLAQEGDDISSLEVPKEEVPPPPEPEKKSSSSQLSDPTPQKTADSSTSIAEASPSEVHIKSDRPLFPSVIRLLKENHVSSIDQIKGSGIRGMITKGDVLAFLGKASGPNGSYKDNTPTPSVYKSQAVVSQQPTVPKAAPLDPAGIRRTILTAFLADSLKSRTPAPIQTSLTADSIIADYLPRIVAEEIVIPPTQVVNSTSSNNYLDGLY